MRINETIVHYIGLLLGWCSFIVFALLGWELVEYSEWFASIWAYELNRWIILIGCTFVQVWLLTYTYSYFWGKRKLIRTFKSVEHSDIRDCKDGELVRVQGKLVPLSNTLSAPLSQRMSGAYIFRVAKSVERVTSSGTGTHVRTEKAWETFKQVNEAVDFLIQCDEHYALVRAAMAKFTIQPDTTHDDKSYKRDQGGFLSPEENAMRTRTLESIGVSPKQFVGVYAADVKFEEGVLEPGEQVVALGIGKWLCTSERPELVALKQQGVDRVFEISSGPEDKVQVSDLKDLLKALGTEFSYTA